MSSKVRNVTIWSTLSRPLNYYKLENFRNAKLQEKENLQERKESGALDLGEC